MRLAQTVRLGAWILIGLNLLMAFGSIWVFIRMAPAIEVIIDQNERSLQACEKMLASLAMADNPEIDITRLKISFATALKNAQNNITEEQEPAALNAIDQNYAGAFKKEAAAKTRTVDAILLLGEINREAMVRADKKAQQLGNAGAWGVVFMASAVFLTGMLFLRALKKNLVMPLEEIDAVMTARQRGDTMRRCTGSRLSKDVRRVFSNVNAFLD
ncbi:MAG: hypothetical protein RQ739_00835 [Desulfotignum sp.]|nr:hypothetical protein [Desulfotignum sp.]